VACSGQPKARGFNFQECEQLLSALGERIVERPHELPIGVDQAMASVTLECCQH
jgi:hypothetical protein